MQRSLPSRFFFFFFSFFFSSPSIESAVVDGSGVESALYCLSGPFFLSSSGTCSCLRCTLLMSRLAHVLFFLSWNFFLVCFSLLSRYLFFVTFVMYLIHLPHSSSLAGPGPEALRTLRPLRGKARSALWALQGRHVFLAANSPPCSSLLHSSGTKSTKFHGRHGSGHLLLSQMTDDQHPPPLSSQGTFVLPSSPLGYFLSGFRALWQAS